MTIAAATILLANLLVSNVTWTGNPYSGSLLNGYYYTLDLWNLGSASGTIWISVYRDNIFEIHSNLRNVKFKDPSLGIIGYPDAIYGHSIWYNITTNSNYPLRLLNAPRIVIDVAYLPLMDRCPTDVALDVWLTKNKEYKIRPGDVELMIWLYRKDLVPRGHVFGYIHYKSVNWSVWIDQGEWSYIAFVPSKNISHIRINLNKFIKYLEKIDLINKYYWINDIDFGVEFSKNKENSAPFDFILYYYVNQTIK